MNKSNFKKLVILCPTLSFKSAIKKYSDTKYSTFTLLDTFEITEFPNFFLTGPHIGSAATILLIETLNSLYSVEDFVLIGSCGASDHRLKIGEIITPKTYSTDENYPEQFGADLEGEIISCELQRKINKFFKPVRTHIWTTGLPMLETSSKVMEYCRNEISGIDMEFASTYAYCQFKGFHLGTILIVSDIVGGNSGFKSKEFKKGRREITENIIYVIEND